MRPIVAALFLAACQLGVTPGNLPTYDPGSFCSLAELHPSTVHIRPDADPPTWVDRPDGRRTNLEWPEGFRLSVEGGVGTVIDPDGFVVATDGEPLTDVGGGASARGEDWFCVCTIGGRFYATGEP